ncbi:hypothetical protein KP509_16G004600 [Ceratopteris richardii]|uniref:Uncharacterized protein n=1 Tax=Ceratopteris richardii TaxID=49495 RepID=A0A8T2SXU2_CERRI|nr:hypothetical protein KP509_16G004600 [Ceratopteris richardii]
MVFFDEQNQKDESLLDERASNQDENDVGTSDPPPIVTSSSAPTCSQLFVEVRGHGHGRPVRIDLTVKHNIPPLTRDIDPGSRNTSTPSIPTRNVSTLHPLFDLAGPSSAYSHGRELGGRSSVLALQVPASSLPPPLTASDIADSFQISSSTPFFASLPCSDEASPSTRRSLPCISCQAAPSNLYHGGSAPTSSNNNSSVQTPQPYAIGQEEVARRLTEVLQGRGDENVLLSSSRENVLSQWLQALEVHVIGACRADERLQPILRWNSSCTDADKRLMSHLNQHFNVEELSMLAQCLCAPLVSIRVGKVQQQGRYLCPTNSRGYLSLSMLPSSEMRLSFVGDDDEIERIAAVKSTEDESQVHLEILNSDPSGRSFVLKVRDGKHFFWQSERCMSEGKRLVSEMKDYLLQRPTLSQLTNVNESRLNLFVCQVWDKLDAASASAGFQSSTPFSLSSVPSGTLTNGSASNSVVSSSSSGSRQSPLSPRGSGFKEGTHKASSNMRSFLFPRERHKRRIDKGNSSSVLTFSDSGSTSDKGPDMVKVSLPSCSASFGVSKEKGMSPQLCSVSLSISSPCAAELINTFDQPLKQVVSVSTVSTSFPSALSPISSVLTGSAFSSDGLHLPTPPRLPVPSSSLFAPYYCPCPLQSSALQYAFAPPFLPPVGELSNVSGPTFFSLKPPSSLLAQTTISLDRVSISPIPLPVSSIVNIPVPLQTSNLSSFFSDPIVHIPVVDIQSSNKGFRVAAPPPVSSSGFPAVLPSFLGNVFSGGEHAFDGKEVPGLNIFQHLGLRCQLQDEGAEGGEVLPFFLKNRFLARCSDDSFGKDGIESVSNPCWSNSPELDRMPEFSGPLLGMVPAFLSSGSLSCVVNFRQEHDTGSSTWVSGSRGFYGMSCEPGMPPPSTSHCSTSVGLRIRDDVPQMYGNRTGGVLEWSIDDMHNKEDEAREE